MPRPSTTAPVIIEAAINGATPKARNPHVPITAAEIAADALRCAAAGAAVVHSHIDDLSLSGTAGGRTPTNSELIEQVTALARTLGRPVATSTEAAQILDLPR